MLIDTHCHLTDRAFDADGEEVVARARGAGVGGMVTIASTVADARAAVDLAREHDDIWCTAGIHPHEAEGYTLHALDEIRALVAAEPSIVALGETGLDHHYDHAPRAIQERSFRAHLELGVELDLPVVVHCREAVREVELMIRSAPEGSRGVLHCFSGDRALLDTALERGWSVSFGGVVTFRRFDQQELLRAVPGDRLMLETDSPYLAPVPFRGKRNEPGYLPGIRDVVAVVRGEDPGAVEAMTTENAVRFFRLDGTPRGGAP